MPSGKKMPSTPIKQRTKSAPVSKKSPGGAVFRRVLTKGLGVAKKMTIPSPKKQQAYHKQVAKLTQPPLQKKLKTSSKSVKRATKGEKNDGPFGKGCEQSRARGRLRDIIRDRFRRRFRRVLISGNVH